MGKRLKIGDIIEIQTSLGYTYAQYTHKHSVYGSLLRVFKKAYVKPLQDYSVVLSDQVQFSTFFPLGPAVSRGIFEVVSNCPVNESLKSFPLFRAGSTLGLTRKVSVWWLWDGEVEEKIGSLSEEQKKLPIRGIINDTMLIEYIESGWVPEIDPRT